MAINKTKKTRFNKELRSQIKASFQGIDRIKLVKALKSSENTLSQIANGILVVSPKRAILIESLTEGKVPAAVLRPDIFNATSVHARKSKAS